MNWISWTLLALCLLACSACGAPATGAGDDSRSYRLHYQIELHPETATATVAMTLKQPRELLREYSFDFNDSISAIENDGGTIRLSGAHATWTPDRHGGELSWTASIDNRRRDSGYDAMLTTEFGVFRAEDAIPRARSRTLKGAASETTLGFTLPRDWSVVTEYSSLQDPLKVVRPGRQLSQPTGWIAAGVLGVRRDTIAGTRVAIAGPQGHAVRRMDMLALLNWTLPELENVFGTTPDRLTIVSADDPMWRGGLSAPASVFLHADRPLISENATSTLLHEVMHVALGLRAAAGYDWIVEGLAEYYSLELLHRGGAITSRRHARALEEQSQWAEDADTLCGRRSSGAQTALAVTVFRKLDAEIQAATEGRASLDDAAAALKSDGRDLDLKGLRQAVRSLIGAAPDSLRFAALPGCNP